jgi:proline dehydrogenase
MLRAAILWAAGNPFLRNRLPRFRAVRWVLARYMPGETLDAALDAARRLERQGIGSTLTYLGENVSELGQAAEVAEEYLTALERASEVGLDAELSVKLTHLGLDLDPAMAAEHLLRLVERANQLQMFVWIDMESSAYVDRTLDLYGRARQRFPNVGICLQAYLRRTGQDVADLLPLSPAIRLVKGAYDEAPRLAYRDRAEIRQSFFGLAMRSLAARRDHDIRLALGTHDLDLVEHIDRAAARHGLSDGSEIHMLYGVRAADQLRIAGRGRRVRVLVAYGSNWYPWFMRRLAERPANVLLAVRGLLDSLRNDAPTGVGLDAQEGIAPRSGPQVRLANFRRWSASS